MESPILFVICVKHGAVRKIFVCCRCRQDRYQNWGGRLHLCWCFPGSVTVQLASLENQESVDVHYPMVAVGGALPKGEVGSLRFRTHYKHQVLLPQAEYTSLKEVSGLLDVIVCLSECGVGVCVCVCIHVACVCTYVSICM